MPAQYIEKIQRLAGQCDGRDVVLYFPDFDAPPGPGSLHQVGGPPIGVTDADWPRSELVKPAVSQSGSETDDDRMEHVFTIDLRGVDLPGAPRGARALQLYVTSTSYNEAWEQGSDHTRVVFLDEATVARGPFTGELPPQTGRSEPRKFSLVRVEVPRAVFSAEPGDDSPLGELRKAIYQAPARLGGEPIWLQGDESDDYGGDYGDDDDSGDEDSDDDGDDDDGDDDGDEGDDDARASAPLGIPGGHGFLLQFDEAFADINLGDAGVMYVFGHDAWFQCH